MVKKFQVAGGNVLAGSEVSLMPGTFMGQFISKAKSGVGGDVVGPFTFNGDAQTIKILRILNPLFDFNGTLFKKFKTRTPGCDPNAVETTGTDGIVDILNLAGKFICR